MQSSVELVWTFILDYTKGWGVRRHDHDYFQMYYCLSGSGSLILEGRELHLAKNDCLVIRPNQAHEISPIRSGQFRIIDTKFHILDNALRQAVLNMPLVVTITAPNFQEIQQNMRNEWASGNAYSRDMATLLFEESLLLFLRQGKPAPAEVPFYHTLEQKVGDLTGVPRRIADFLSDHYWEDVSLERLAKELRYSKNYLCRVFKSSTDCTISEYGNFLRVRKAYDLICCTDQKLSEIAVNCGFSSIHYFSRVFSKYVGMSPSQARDRDRNTLNTDIRLHGTFHYRYYTPGL